MICSLNPGIATATAKIESKSKYLNFIESGVPGLLTSHVVISQLFHQETTLHAI